jgi:hypothetical protein
MQGPDLLRELAELGVEVCLVRDARAVGSEQGPVSFSDPAGIEVRISGADDQRAGGPGMTRRELQGRLSAVAPPADDGALQSELGDQRRDVVSNPGIGELSCRVGRAAMPAAVGRDDPEAVGELGHHRLPLGA